MFTGIVDHCGELTEIDNLREGKRFWITTKFEDLVQGESISVNGGCLTVTGHKSNQFSCDLSPETLKLTSANYLKVGDSVNLERSLRLSDRLGGHMVTGHVDQTCILKSKQAQGDFWQYRFHGLWQDANPFFIKKGSVAVNGVSLTLNEVYPGGFEVMLIPETLQKTNLGLLQPGDHVNIEYDYFAKLVAKQVEAYSEIVDSPVKNAKIF